MDVRLDHLVCWVSDQLRALDFYERVVGLPGVRATEFRAGEAPFPSVRISDTTILDLMRQDAAGQVDEGTGVKGSAGHPVNHFCLSVGRADFEALKARLERHGVQITGTGTDSFGAQGISPEVIYFPDPDDNVIEIRYYA
ncbi:VOC family protein [Nonomuraea sp. NPDC048916]|uniref:VOC family protein n=1 Tax=Nonomuraea sp. NPDC048916 TaxID=3154232 RepID=UPI0033F19132